MLFILILIKHRSLKKKERIRKKRPEHPFNLKSYTLLLKIIIKFYFL